MTWNVASGLENKGVIVTGAAGGIGREVTLAFAAAGARVCGMDRDEKRLAAVIAECAGGPHLALAADLRDIASHERLLARAGDGLGRLDVLVCAAAVLIRRPDLDAVTEEDWDIQHEVNLKSTFFLNRAAARAFRKEGRGGRIVNFASQAWWNGGFDGSVVYAATKGGIVSMTRGLARSFARDGITVNALSPGAADTPMLREGLNDEQIAGFVSQIPLGRMAQPSELVGTVLFLASDHAGYITGATINVSGGWLMY